MGAETNRRDFFNMSGASMLAALASKPAHAGVLSESVDQAGNASEKAGAALPTRPNIIPLHARRDARGQSGLLRNPVTRTPNFDRLAKEGTRFSNCHVQLYSYEDDPQEMHNRYGEPGVASVQSALQTALLSHYINTMGIAPMDKDPRDCPPFYPTRMDIPAAH